MGVKHAPGVPGQGSGDGLKLGQDVSVWEEIKIRWSHGWAGLGRNMEGPVAPGKQIVEPQLKSRSPGKEEQALSEASSGFLHSSSHQLAKHFALRPAVKAPGRGPMSRTLTGYILWKAMPSTYCNQTSQKCLPFSQGFDKQVLNVSFNA